MNPRRTIETASGPVIGSVDDDLVHVRGVPYATAARFRAPTAVDPWNSPREAFSRGPASPQDPSRLDGVAGTVGAELSQSEHCQVLTVTATADAREQPVMIWFHGGAYVSGAGEAGEYDADDLAREGVVVVSVTYRLGVLGYLSPSGSTDDNLGLLDQIAALRWVRANIAAFGGDPERVTIFGHSAGGDSVVSILLSEVADGLYRRAIVQSAPLGLRVGRDAMVDALRATMGRLLPDPLAVSVDDVLVAQREIVAAGAEFGTVGAMAFGTQMGSAPLPADDVADARLAQVARRCDLLVGYTAQDASPFVLLNPHGARLPRLGVPGRLVFRLAVARVTRSVFGRPAGALASRWTSAGGAAAQYVFTWRPRSGVLGACHSIELPFLFSGDWSDAEMLGGQEPDPKVAARIRRTWANFARHGVAGLGSRSLIF